MRIARGGEMKMRFVVLGAVLSSVVVPIQPSIASSVTLDTGVPTSEKYGFSAGAPTLGETFVAPITGTLTSFTLYLTETSPANFVGAVDSWNPGQPGSTGNLYESAPVAATVTGFPPAAAVAYTFSTNVSVVAGQSYVAFLTMYGVSGPVGNGQMPFQFTSSSASADGGGGNAYWTYSSPFANGTWVTDGKYPGWVELQATFTDASPTPLPAALPLFATGAGVIGLFGWRKKRKAAAPAA